MSIQSHMANLLLRYFFKNRFGRKTTLNPQQVRDAVAQTTRFNPPLPKGVVAEQVPARPAQGLCAAQWFKSSQPERTFLYLHGGGYFFGDIKTHEPICAALADKLSAQVLLIQYRLAPEHPFPAALDDALAWYRHLIAAHHIPPSSLSLAGDSAGGGLAVACLLAAKDHALPMPNAALLFSPWTDLAGLGETLQTNNKTEVMLPPHLLSQAAQFYVGGHSLQHPLISPLYGDLTGLPPLMIHASEQEILLSDATRLHSRAQAAGVASHLHLKKNLAHAWTNLAWLPEAKDTMLSCRDFILQHERAQVATSFKRKESAAY